MRPRPILDLLFRFGIIGAITSSAEQVRLSLVLDGLPTAAAPTMAESHRSYGLTTVGPLGVAAVRALIAAIAASTVTTPASACFTAV